MDTLFFDVAVIGSGPGGYPAAIRLAQHGKKVALIEAGAVGGTCLNRGCIPTKALLANAEVLHIVKQAQHWGITTSAVSFDFEQMMKRKDELVRKIRSSLEGLILGNGVTIISGRASFIGAHELKVEGSTPCIIKAANIIIATGSEPKEIRQFPFDGQLVHSSTSILELKKLPKSLVIIGGGVIGCEFASLFNELGVKVTIIEMLDRIIPLECPTLSAALQRSFQKRGITLKVSTKVQSIKTQTTSVLIAIEGESTPLEAEMALVAVGRELNSTSMGLEASGVKIDRGAIVIDDAMETSVSNVFAIGDVTAKSMYAHVATHQGFVAADKILGLPAHINYDAVPGVIFTDPEIASVGMTLDSAKARGYRAKRATYPFQALGKAQATHQTEGFAQIISEEETDRILGAQVFGKDAGNLIQAITLAITHEYTLDSILETIHAHPTLSEAWMEAAFIAQGLPLHFPKSALTK